MKKVVCIYFSIMLGSLGLSIGASLTLLMYKMRPELIIMMPTLSILNIGFFTAYLSSLSLSQDHLTSHFICVFSIISVLICMLFYGISLYGLINAFIHLLSIAGCAFFSLKVLPILKDTLLN